MPRSCDSASVHGRLNIRHCHLIFTRAFFIYRLPFLFFSPSPPHRVLVFISLLQLPDTETTAPLRDTLPLSISDRLLPPPFYSLESEPATPFEPADGRAASYLLCD